MQARDLARRTLFIAVLASSPIFISGIAYWKTIARTKPAAFTMISVNTTLDVAANDGLCSLREAITSANTNSASGVAAGECVAGVPGLDNIVFNLGVGTPRINVLSELPTIIESVTISGNTGGSTRVELNGTQAGAANGLRITAGSSTIQGLVINQFRDGGIRIESLGGNIVKNCYLGTDTSGAAALGNFAGLVVTSANNIIGSPIAIEHNVISGNTFGVAIGGLSANDNKVIGNFIGTDDSGTKGLGNTSIGVWIVDASNNTIGGTAVGERNIISGNKARGVEIGGPRAKMNRIIGNYIGTDINGTPNLGNFTGGVLFGLSVSNNAIGGMNANEGNVIAGNNLRGVAVESIAVTSNPILGNAIFNNSLLGIDIGPSGVTANDQSDYDSGPNNQQNFPVLDTATSINSSTTIKGILNSLWATSFRIEFFVNDACDKSGNGEGQTFIGFQNVVTDGSGNALIDATLGIPIGSGRFVTATATRLDGANNPVETSEFSACQRVVADDFLRSSLVDPLGCAAIGDLVNGLIQVANPNLSSQSFTLTTTFTNLVGLPGSCIVTGAQAGATCTVTTSGLTASGVLAAGAMANVQYQSQIADGTLGTASASSVATVAAVTTSPVVASLSVNCPQAGPGLLPGGQNAVSDQKPGSVIVYPLYSSSASNASTQNTRIAITNTNSARQAIIHLFFVDGSSCSVADSYICLTPNQTATVLASDIDPGTTGYLVAVAVDAAGCPISFNHLIGDEFVKLASGHQSNLGAESIAAVAGGLTACNALTDSNAVLAFNNVSYNALPRVLASSNIPSRGDSNDTYVVIDRIGGNLSTAGSTIGGLFGILYDDAEAAYSFSLPASACQSAGSITNDRPRVVPRFETVIPSGRTGWFKIWGAADVGIIGVQINRNHNAGTNAAAFNHGHNLHKLTFTTTSTLTIPVFPPSC